MMQWKRTSDYSVATHDERFHIARAVCSGIDKFTLWDGKNIVKSFPTAAQAREAAEQIKSKS